MVRLCLGLMPIAFFIAAPLTALLVRLGHRYQTFDSQGVAGQVKAPRRKVPNTGGIAIFWGIALPLLLGVWAFTGVYVDPNDFSLIPADLVDHLPGIDAKADDAVMLIACTFVLHLLGLIDDRRPLGPFLKLGVMAGASAAMVYYTDTRLLTLLDAHVGGTWLSIVLTVLWVLVVTNAMNFLDNMDGLSAGVAAIAGACLFASAVLGPTPQWFIAAVLALVVGSCVGFLCFNAPRRSGAKIFMGDGGSLVVGFLLSALSVRLTYTGGVAPSWYAVLTPLVILAVPLYDFLSVVTIRVRQGKSPFVGDLQHLSHRFTRLGLTRPKAVAVIWGAATITGLGGVFLARAEPAHAVVIGVQTVLMLIVLAFFEFSARPPEGSEGGE